MSLQTEVGGRTSLDITPLVTTVDSPIDINSIRVIQQPMSGAMALVTNGSLEVDYAGVSFAGTDRLTLEACDQTFHCAQKEFTIEVGGEVLVYNAISPNGDGKHELFFLKNISTFPENKVIIFNRWGDEVFAMSNYDNNSHVFRGLNKNGDELPTGTYFYKIEFASGKKTMTGYLSLKR